MDVVTFNISCFVKCTRKCKWCYLKDHIIPRTTSKRNIRPEVRDLVKKIQGEVGNKADLLFLSLPFNTKDVKRMVYAIEQFFLHSMDIGVSYSQLHLLGQPRVIHLLVPYVVQQISDFMGGKRKACVLSLSSPYDVSEYESLPIRADRVAITEVTGSGEPWSEDDIRSIATTAIKNAEHAVVQEDLIVETVFGHPGSGDEAKRVVKLLRDAGAKASASGCTQYVGEDGKCTSCFMTEQDLRNIETLRDRVHVGCPYKLCGGS